MIYSDLLIIMTIIALGYESGFVDNLDEWVNRKWKFHHLPHLVLCRLCSTWWISLFWIIVTGNLSLLNIMVCLLFANLGEFVAPLLRVTKSFVYALLEGFEDYFHIKY